jgi:hypothetical protein
MDISAAITALLFKYGLFTASLFGSLLSLSLLRPLSKKEAALAIATGFFTAIFTTDLMIAHFGLPSDGSSRNGVAYLIGLTAMNFIPAIKLMAKSIARAALKKGSHDDFQV